MDSYLDTFTRLFAGEEGEVPLSLPLHSQVTVPLPTYKSSFADSDPWKQTISLATKWHHTSAAELVPEEPNTCLCISTDTAGICPSADTHHMERQHRMGPGGYEWLSNKQIAVLGVGKR